MQSFDTVPVSNVFTCVCVAVMSSSSHTFIAKLAGGAITVESISKYVADLYSVGRDKALLAADDVDGVRIRALTRDLLVAMQLDHAVSANKPGDTLRDAACCV